MLSSSQHLRRDVRTNMIPANANFSTVVPLLLTFLQNWFLAGRYCLTRGMSLFSPSQLLEGSQVTSYSHTQSTQGPFSDTQSVLSSAGSVPWTTAPSSSAAAGTRQGSGDQSQGYPSRSIANTSIQYQDQLNFARNNNTNNRMGQIMSSAAPSAATNTATSSAQRRGDTWRQQTQRPTNDATLFYKRYAEQESLSQHLSNPGISAKQGPVSLHKYAPARPRLPSDAEADSAQDTQAPFRSGIASYTAYVEDLETTTVSSTLSSGIERVSRDVQCLTTEVGEIGRAIQSVSQQQDVAGSEQMATCSELQKLSEETKQLQQSVGLLSRQLDAQRENILAVVDTVQRVLQQQQQLAILVEKQNKQLQGQQQQQQRTTSTQKQRVPLPDGSPELVQAPEAAAAARQLFAEPKQQQQRRARKTKKRTRAKLTSANKKKKQQQQQPAMSARQRQQQQQALIDNLFFDSDDSTTSSDGGDEGHNATDGDSE
ncbi:hypothetical protein PTSG_03623 [Salpingoeca rosetta]|uniref:Uncharacterized protein n=1 Tax=Salpingoeca rosetta (strain ATCC 50818 / BSB-021) TaxID=946362 RepID=F2U646_SALR5|nr:uncharacterized protein PTSG_03623 [Salpingoeca rosetta]EGD82987.1 hypothetical protein PTSG_03623 [Salpingoeca rosetta]|eukprot:XP_004995351.1 hypothetical protein PTSG_03623 [Salpingoeca rosetta]